MSSRTEGGVREANDGKCPTMMLFRWVGEITDHAQVEEIAPQVSSDELISTVGGGEMRGKSLVGRRTRQVINDFNIP